MALTFTLLLLLFYDLLMQTRLPGKCEISNFLPGNPKDHTILDKREIYGKYPKNSNTKASDKMTYANSVDHDQTAPEGAV